MTDRQHDLSRRSDGVAEAERDLREALAVDPPLEFAARVRARIADEPGLERRFRFWTWMPIAAGALAAAALAVAVWPSRAPIAAPRPPVLPGRSIVAAATPPAVTPSAARRAAPAVRPVRHARSSEPEILISPSESRAILNLIAGIRTGRIDPSTLPAAASAADMEIEPIVIAPLPAFDGSQGVRQ